MIKVMLKLALGHIQVFSLWGRIEPARKVARLQEFFAPAARKWN